MNEIRRQSATKIRRKNTSKACEECRRRRQKCDGHRPSCSRCRTFNVACRYASEADGRQPAPKSYVLLLRRRIEILENALRHYGIDIPTAIARGESMVRSSHDTATQVSQMGTHDDEMSEKVNALSNTMQGTFTLDESLSFDADGEPRYFGPTSGRQEFVKVEETNTSTAGTSRISDFQIRPTSHKGPSSYDLSPQLESEPDRYEVSAELRTHLIDLYFTWQDPWFTVVDRQLFEESERSHGRYYSVLLLYSILALGSRFSDRIEIRSNKSDSNTAGVIFLRKAESLLHHDLKWPSLTTIQSLCILSNVYVAIGSDAGCWLHQGMAIRLAIDMGFNIDPTSLASNGIMSTDEANLRRQIYWSLYCNDKLSAAYTGRICTLLDSQGDVEPLSNPVSDLPSKQPELSKSSHSKASIAARNASGVFCTVFVRLSGILESILTSLYSPKTNSKEQRTSSFLDACLLDLKNWFYDLPHPLKIEKSTEKPILCNIFVLHMVFHTAHILLAKPFISQTRKPTDVERFDSIRANAHVGQKAQKVCIDAAQQICAVARKYRETYGSFRQSPITATHCTLSAALILLQKLRINGVSPARGDQRNLDLCLTVLEELSTSWQPAKRLLSNTTRLLSSLKEQFIVPGAGTAKENQPATIGVNELFHNVDDSAVLDAQVFMPSITSQHQLLMNVSEVGDLDFDEQSKYAVFMPSFDDIDVIFTDSMLPEDYFAFDAGQRWNPGGILE